MVDPWIIIGWVVITVVVAYRLGRMQNLIGRILEEVKEFNLSNGKRKRKTEKSIKPI